MALLDNTISKFAVIVLAVNLQWKGLAEAGRVKIHLSPELAPSDIHELSSKFLRFKHQAPVSACDDKRITVNTPLPVGVRDRLNSRVRYFSSTNARNYINTSVFTRTVSGLEVMETVGEVFSVLQSQCYPFFFGGVVRDMFLARMPADVDVEVDCDVNDVLQLCRKTWGEQNCQVNNDIAHIGHMDSPNDQLDLKSTDSTFFMPLSSLEYTVNSLAYDLNNDNNIIIDLSGTGVDDVCNKLIRIPSDDNSQQSWDDWRMAVGGTTKLYRFWKLHIKGLVPVNEETLQYIVSNTLMQIDNRLSTFGRFYCTTVYSDSTYDGRTNTCTVSSGQTVCSDNEAKAQTYDQRFMEDFGDDYGKLQPNIPKCGSAQHLASMVIIAVCILLALEVA